MVSRLLLYELCIAASVLVLTATSCAGDDDGDCGILTEEECSGACAGVYSGSTSILAPCQVVGKFMGCAPAADSDFWRRQGGSQSEVQAVCDFVIGEDAYPHCFEGKVEVYWYFENIDRFCTDSCLGKPLECDQP